MHRLTSRRPSPAMVVATVALVVALGGTGYAATALPNGSVGTNQLRNGAVNSSKLASGAVQSNNLGTDSVTKRAMSAGSVGSPEILNNSIQAGDLRVGAVTNGTIAAGAVGNSKLRSGAVTTGKLGNLAVTSSKIGTRAVTNNKIGTGQVGARALRGYVVRSARVTISGGSAARVATGLVKASCRSGEQAVGVGTSWNGGPADDLNTVFARFVTTSNGTPTGATARGSSGIAPARVFTVQVACLLP